MGETQQQMILFFGMTKTQFLTALVVILALSTIGQAWTIFTTTHLADTQRSICHIVADSNRNVNQVRSRIQSGAQRYRDQAALDNTVAQAWTTIQGQIKTSGLNLHPIIDAWNEQAALDNQAALELTKQAQNTKPVTLAGC